MILFLKHVILYTLLWVKEQLGKKISIHWKLKRNKYNILFTVVINSYSCGVVLLNSWQPISSTLKAIPLCQVCGLILTNSVSTGTSKICLTGVYLSFEPLNVYNKQNTQMMYSNSITTPHLWFFLVIRHVSVWNSIWAVHNLITRHIFVIQWTAHSDDTIKWFLTAKINLQVLVFVGYLWGPSTAWVWQRYVCYSYIVRWKIRVANAACTEGTVRQRHVSLN